MARPESSPSCRRIERPGARRRRHQRVYKCLRSVPTEGSDLNLGKVALYSLKLEELQELVLRILDELLNDR